MKTALMSTAPSHLAPADLAKVASLQILARLVVEGFTTGLHRSPHKGFSVEFKQHRQYVPGDEIRHLDWKVFGKTDRFYIREYEEETNLRAHILLDVSGSMAYGQAPPGRARADTSANFNELSKHHYATRVAAALSYLMLQQADSVGLVTFDDRLRHHIPPRGRPSHLKALMSAMQAANVGGETDIGRVLHDLAPKLHRRGLVILISDCFGDVASLMKGLAHFRHARHEVIIFQIWHRDELDFPFRRFTRFDSLENTAFHTLDPAHVRRAYMQHLEKFRGDLKTGCARHKIDLVPLITDEPYADALAKYLAARRKR